MNFLSLVGNKNLSQLEEYLSLVERGEAVGPFLVMGQSGTGKKRLLRQLVLMSNRSFNFIKVEGKATSQRYEGSSWNDLRQALEKLGDEMGISLLEEEDDLISVWNQLQGLSKEKTALILLENAQWFDAVSLEKSETTREERRSQEKWQLIFSGRSPTRFLRQLLGGA